MTNSLKNASNDLIIAKATIDNSKQIVDFLNSVAGETDFLTFGFNEFPFSIEQETNIISECLEKNRCLMLVGKVDNSIVSQLFIDVSSSKRLSHIGHLGISVRKKFWGKSVGTRMIIAAIDWAKEKNLAKLQLQVRSDNAGAVALYKKFGFIIEGTIKRSIKIDTTYYDEFLMGLLL